MRERRNNEVRRLREEISEKRLAIYTVTKGIPFNRLEVRPEDQIPQNSFEKLLSSPSKKPSVAVPLPYMQERKKQRNIEKLGEIYFWTTEWLGRKSQGI